MVKRKKEKFVTTLKLKEGYKTIVDTAAEKQGMHTAEFQRRAIFAAIVDPSILHIADEMEEEYSSGLGSSRHYKIP